MATPKSASAGSPNSVIRMFCGLTSRCRISARWAVSRAPAILMPSATTSATGSPAPPRIRSPTEPWHSSSTRTGRLSAARNERNSVTMLGCELTAPSAMDSRSKDSSARGDASRTFSSFSAT